MKAYWDSSALVQATSEIGLRRRLRAEGGITRCHALAEVFSALTSGRLAIRLDANDAAATVENLASDLELIELSAPEIVTALKQARTRGVRGGRVHDYIHARVVEKSGGKVLLTADRNDFENLVDTVTVHQA
jgi:predicted nucleic acid-binding protein